MTIACRTVAQLLFTALLALVVASCDQSGDTDHPQRTAIEAALAQAFEHRRVPFVIIEGECDGFGQFMHDNGTLYYDFPNADLGQSEQARARKYHREQEIEELVIEDIDPATMPAFQLRTWQRAYSRDQVGDVGDALTAAAIR